MLTKPGLSSIGSAIIGARMIFQRMTTFTRYTVGMTFRVCFTFGLLTVIYDWCAPARSICVCCWRLHLHAISCTAPVRGRSLSLFPYLCS